MTEAQSVRRIVVVDEDDRSKVIADGPSPDVRRDPARPGFSCARIWVTDRTPVRLEALRESLHLPHTLVPPPGGSTCYVITLPPDAGYPRRLRAQEGAAYLATKGAPHISHCAAPR